jgi:hypothetical protein
MVSIEDFQTAYYGAIDYCIYYIYILKRCKQMGSRYFISTLFRSVGLPLKPLQKNPAKYHKCC